MSQYQKVVAKGRILRQTWGAEVGSGNPSLDRAIYHLLAGSEGVPTTVAEAEPALPASAAFAMEEAFVPGGIETPVPVHQMQWF